MSSSLPSSVVVPVVAALVSRLTIAKVIESPAFLTRFSLTWITACSSVPISGLNPPS